ncbi:MAG: GNAT family N-acetyltransferase [Candidatus Promineifilaceae bacterium]
MTEQIVNTPATTASPPAGFTSRQATMADAAPVTDLLNASAIAQIGHEEFDLEETHVEWQTPGFDLENSSQIVIAPTGQIVGYMEVWDIAATPVHPWLWGRVHPQYEGLGIGSYLMDWAEAKAHRVIDRVPPEARISVRCGCISSYAPANTLFVERGMACIRYFYRMQIDLDQPPAPAQFPPHIVVQTLVEQPDLRAIFHALEDSFSDHWGHVPESEEKVLQRWRHMMATDKDFDPALWFLAMDGAEIAGISLCSPRLPEDENLGWVGQLGVRRPWRRQGLGLALLQHTFVEMHRRGKKRVGLGVDASSLTGATRLYEKAGMVVARQFNTYDKEIRPGVELGLEALSN